MKHLLPLLLLFLLPWHATADSKGVKVAVSIKPLHSLVSSIMQGVAEPVLIVSTSGTPHGYNLRPSEARALQQADLIIWVGPELESFMAKSLSNITTDELILTLLTDLPELLTHSARQGGVWGENHEHAGIDHQGDNTDPHIWLNPKNASIIAGVITQKLVAIDPDNTARYVSNHAALLDRLASLEQKISRRLTRLKKRKYIVFHDAYQYFENHFELKPVGALAIDPDRRPGARRLTELKKVIRDLSVECVFTEPQFEPRLIKVLTEGTMIRTGILDPLGSDLQPGSELYFTLMEQMADSLESCLPEKN